MCPEDVDRAVFASDGQLQVKQHSNIYKNIWLGASLITTMSRTSTMSPWSAALAKLVTRHLVLIIHDYSQRMDLEQGC